MPMGVYTLARTFWCVCGYVYTQRGFLHCLFEITGFLRTSNDG